MLNSFPSSLVTTVTIWGVSSILWVYYEEGLASTFSLKQAGRIEISITFHCQFLTFLTSWYNIPIKVCSERGKKSEIFRRFPLKNVPVHHFKSYHQPWGRISARTTRTSSHIQHMGPFKHQSRDRMYKVVCFLSIFISVEPTFC